MGSGFRRARLGGLVWVTLCACSLPVSGSKTQWFRNLRKNRAITIDAGSEREHFDAKLVGSPEAVPRWPIVPPAQRLRAVAYTSIHETLEHPAVPCPPPGMRST
jgi:hypothetical protein